MKPLAPATVPSFGTPEATWKTTHKTSNIMSEIIDQPSNHLRKIPGSIYDISLVDRYVRSRLNVHVHWIGRGTGYCVAARLKTLADPPKCEIGEQNPTVLVEVNKLIQYPEGMALEPIRSVVWLQTLDLCTHVFGKAREPRLPRLVERFRTLTDGERVFSAGYVVVGKNKFPHHVIERRTEILKAIPDDQWNSTRNFRFNRRAGIEVGIQIDHQFVSVSLEFDAHIPQENIEVLFGPEDFQTN